MDAVYEEINRDLLHFIAKAPSVFHAVNSIQTALSYAGFTEIREEDPWQIGKRREICRHKKRLRPHGIYHP